MYTVSTRVSIRTKFFTNILHIKCLQFRLRRNNRNCRKFCRKELRLKKLAEKWRKKRKN